MKTESTLRQLIGEGTPKKGASMEKLVGLLGDPVTHTLSPAMQNAAFQALGVNCRYMAFCVDAEGFDAAMKGLSVLGAVGTNITVPHKERAFRWVEKLDPSAARTGAVNTVIFRKRESMGYNTDVSGIRTALATLPFLKGKALVLGAGGAARAALCALVDKGFTHIALSNRTAERAEKLCRQLLPEEKGTVIPWGVRPSFLPDLVVNTTSLGLDHSPWPENLLKEIVSWAKNGMLLDMVYMKDRDTALCEGAKAAGITTISGQEVLLHQGTAAFELFSGLAAPVEVMRAMLKKEGESKFSRKGQIDL